MNKRRNFLKKGASIAVAGSISSMAFGNSHNEQAKPGLLHIVVIWLKNPEKDLKQYLIDTEEFVTHVPSVKSYHIGIPAPTDRPIIDNSYSLCLTVGFEDMAGHDQYQEDPIHKAFVAKSKALWEKVLIYDAITP